MAFLIEICLDSGNNSADAKAWEELNKKFNTLQGLLRDAYHASYYGTFLADIDHQAVKEYNTLKRMK